MNADLPVGGGAGAAPGGGPGGAPGGAPLRGPGSAPGGGAGAAPGGGTGEPRAGWVPGGEAAAPARRVAGRPVACLLPSRRASQAVRAAARGPRPVGSAWAAEPGACRPGRPGAGRGPPRPGRPAPIPPLRSMTWLIQAASAGRSARLTSSSRRGSRTMTSHVRAPPTTSPTRSTQRTQDLDHRRQHIAPRGSGRSSAVSASAILQPCRPRSSTSCHRRACLSAP